MIVLVFVEIVDHRCYIHLRELAKYYLADFFCLGVPPYPTPSTENHFATKKLSRNGGNSPSLNRKSPKKGLKLELVDQKLGAPLGNLSNSQEHREHQSSGAP